MGKIERGTRKDGRFGEVVIRDAGKENQVAFVSVNFKYRDGSFFDTDTLLARYNAFEPGGAVEEAQLLLVEFVRWDWDGPQYEQLRTDAKAVLKKLEALLGKG